MNHQARYDQAVDFVCLPLRQPLAAIPPEHKARVCEIRLRAGRPVVLTESDGCKTLDADGRVYDHPPRQPLICSYECLEQTFRSVCGYSVHTHQSEMIHGYVSLRGGHRVGLGGTAVEKNGQITSVKEISSLCIRVARQVFGAADRLVAPARQGGLLVIGRPGSGKTTVLRDLCRQLSQGKSGIGFKVTLLDERGELAGMWDGMPQNDVGPNTDVLNGFSKASAMEMAVRSLSPDVIICDEIGSRAEAAGMLACMNAGVRVMASVHAGDLAEVRRKPWVGELIRAGVFAHVALLPGRAEESGNVAVYGMDEWMHEMAGDLAGGCGDERGGCAGMETL